MADYPLKTILATFTKTNGKRRSIFNKGPIGGLSSDLVTLFFFSLPLISYGLLFNPYSFQILGIASSITIFIVSLSFIMLIVFFITWSIKESVIKAITPSWKKYFNDVDLQLVVSKGITPYNDFYKHYSKIKDIKQSEEELHKQLLDAFKIMEEENKELLFAMRKDNANNKKAL
jgi:hypothetical protein